MQLLFLLLKIQDLKGNWLTGGIQIAGKEGKKKTNKSNKKIEIRLGLTQLIVQHPCWLENGIVIPEYQTIESWQEICQIVWEELFAF